MEPQNYVEVQNESNSKMRYIRIIDKIIEIL